MNNRGIEVKQGTNCRTEATGPALEYTEFSKQETRQSIADRFTAQVRKHPQRLAIKASGTELTYDQLNQAANRVANTILSCWKHYDGPIAVLLPQGIENITVILGILKSGKFYLPFDPTVVTARDNQVLAEAKAMKIVTNAANLEKTGELTNSAQDVLNIDAITPDTSIADPVITISPDVPAYILYTSGSTGKPKGVIHSHRSVLHNVLRHTNSFFISHRDRQTLLYPTNVYGGTRDIYNALLNGASLHLYSVKDYGVSDLARWLNEEKITLYCSVATVFRHLMRSLSDIDEFPTLRLIKLGGEVTYKTDVELFKAHFPTQCLLHCGLGSTETGVVRHFFVTSDTIITGNTVPLGYAIDDLEVLLLDENREPVSPGNEGEIAIKSRYIAQGYWLQDKLTRASFMSCGGNSSERIYLTGDLGYLRPDGCLEHRGRKDSQVKIRGNRVDIIEIETSLLELESVTEAAVIVRKNTLGDNELVAYCVTSQDNRVEREQLRATLTERLPGHLIPSSFVFPDSLPLTPNGKLDRKALQQSGCTRPAPQCRVLPRTPVEQEIATLWKKLLQTTQVGIHDNFFDCGGHSLLATQLVSHINDRFNIKLPMRILFETPDICGLGVRVVEHMAQDSDSD